MQIRVKDSYINDGVGGDGGGEEEEREKHLGLQEVVVADEVAEAEVAIVSASRSFFNAMKTKFMDWI